MARLIDIFTDTERAGWDRVPGKRSKHKRWHYFRVGSDVSACYRVTVPRHGPRARLDDLPPGSCLACRDASRRDQGKGD